MSRISPDIYLSDNSILIMSIFKRNLTSKLLEQSASIVLDEFPFATLLEIGCGDGNISRSLATRHKNAKYFASDISASAIDMAIELDKYQRIEFRMGNLFQPWKGERFEIILSDVAAISVQIARLSDWYDGVPCDSGFDGLDLVSEVIRDSAKYLTKGGIFILPVLSLCNYNQLLTMLNNTFLNVKLGPKKMWPVPFNIIDSMIKENISFNTQNWEIQEQYGIRVAWTLTAICTNVRKGVLR